MEHARIFFESFGTVLNPFGTAPKYRSPLPLHRAFRKDARELAKSWRRTGAGLRHNVDEAFITYGKSHYSQSEK
jgi:hypothetical protein